MLLVVLYSTAATFGFIQTTSTPGRFYWGRRLLLFHDLVASVLQWNGTSSSHMRCRMTASFRATAITARRWPRVLASLIPQAFNGDHFELRVSNALAAV